MKIPAGNKSISLATPITFQDALPDAVDVMVIGAGVIGICSALYMARAGLSVLVVEKGRIAGEQSSRNWGWVRQHGRDAAELPIMMTANRLWQALDQETGGATGFRQEGVCYVASGEGELQKLVAWLDIARAHGLDTRLMSRDELATRVAHADGPSARRWVGGTITPSDGRAEPWQAVPAFARLAHESGALIREHCAVRELITQGGAITGVNTEHGTVRCDRVVLAAGAWSSLFLQRHRKGLALPQLSVRATVAQTAPLPSVFEGNFADEELAVRRRADGGYTLACRGTDEHFIGPDSFRHFFRFLPLVRSAHKAVKISAIGPAGLPDSWQGRRATGPGSPFETVRVLNPQPDGASVQAMQRFFAARFPTLGAPAILHAWAGMIDTTPDVLPILDHHPQLGGLTIATGLSGHGFGIGPGVGQVIAALVAGQPTGYDLEALGMARFVSSGTRDSRLSQSGGQ